MGYPGTGIGPFGSHGTPGSDRLVIPFVFLLVLACTGRNVEGL